MSDDDDGLQAKAVRQVQTHPPRGFAELAPRRRADEAWQERVTWTLACTCGCDRGRLLGHRLSKMNPAYSGELHVSPLHFDCDGCGKVALIIDTQQHGYNSECGLLEDGESWDSNYHGEGVGSATPCAKCGETAFTFEATCSHSHFDHIEDEPELLPRAQDFFDWFTLGATCISCGEVQHPADFETA